MKITIWDILTGLTLLGILCLIGAFGAIYANPAVSFNPFGPPTIVAPLDLPTATTAPTETPGLPPTWTPTPPSADNSQPADGQPTLRPSSTPQPTATFVVLPTFTPSRTPRVANLSNSGGQCQVIYQNPVDDTKFTKNTTFQMRWTLKNTSSKSWTADSIDLKFLSGTRMHSGNDVRDLPYDVGAGASVDILIPMTSPSVNGSYESDWALSAGGTPVCRFFVAIEVK